MSGSPDPQKKKAQKSADESHSAVQNDDEWAEGGETETGLIPETENSTSYHAYPDNHQQLKKLTDLKNEQTRMVDPSQVDSDCDEDETDLMIIASHKRKIIKDWEPEMSYCKALCGGHLRKNDTSVFASLMVSHILILVMGFCICVAETSEEKISFVGVPICSVFLHFFWSDMALAANL
jgi:hypothetical protein